MQFEDRESKTFVTIVDGKFWRAVKPEEADRPGVKFRVLGAMSPNAGKTVYGYQNDVAQGILTGITTKIGDYGKELHLEFDHDTVIQMGFTSAYAEKFMIVLPNIELDRIIYLRTYKFAKKEDRSKFKFGWNIQQRGKDVEHAAAQRNRDGKIDLPNLPVLPDKKMVDVKGDGKMQLVAGERLAWLESNFLNPIIAALEQRKAERVHETNTMVPDDEGPPEYYEQEAPEEGEPGPPPF